MDLSPLAGMGVGKIPANLPSLAYTHDTVISFAIITHFKAERNSVPISYYVILSRELVTTRNYNQFLSTEIRMQWVQLHQGTCICRSKT